VSQLLLGSLLRLRIHGSQLLVKLKNFILLADIMLLLAVYPKHTGVSNEMQTEIPCLLVKLSVVLVHRSDLAKVTRPSCFGVTFRYLWLSGRLFLILILLLLFLLILIIIIVAIFPIFFVIVVFILLLILISLLLAFALRPERTLFICL
jgi:hypothetical protein